MLNIYINNSNSIDERFYGQNNQIDQNPRHQTLKKNVSLYFIFYLFSVIKNHLRYLIFNRYYFKLLACTYIPYVNNNNGC